MLHRVCGGRLRGLSIVELMVAMTVLAVLSVIFASLLGQSRASADLGSTRIAIHAEHRQVQRRLTLLLRSAVPPTEIDPALAWPTLGNSDVMARFHAPVNLLDPSLPFDPRAPDYPEFSLSLTGDGAIEVKRSDSTGIVQRLGKNVDSLNFVRASDKSLEVVLTTEYQVRGAAGARRTLEETSRNLVRVPSIR